MAAIELPVELLELMAIDGAVGFLDDDAMCVKYGVTDTQWTQIQDHPRYRAERDEKRRQLGDGGAEFKMLARSRMGRVIRSVADIVDDEDAHPMARIKGAQLLAGIAGVHTVTTPAQGGIPQQLIIQTNLSLKHTPGVYEIEATAERIYEHED